MTHPVQQPLIPEPQDLVLDALEKVRGAGVLEAREMEALEQAVAAGRPGPKRLPGWQKIVNCWLDAFQRATGRAAPRPTDNEMRQLLTVFHRCGDVDRTCELIWAFWPWRKTNEFRANVPPTTFGLSKHIAEVMEFAAELETKRRAKEKLEIEMEQASTMSPVFVEPTDGEKARQAARAREVLATLGKGKAFP